MRVEASRDAERYVATWHFVSGWSNDQAKNFFIEHKKPSTFVMERFTYNRFTGVFHAYGYDKPCR